ncbi:hypothetical protein G3T14_14130 [Methylobacterium sp. BTF04]|uniref:hypothetical protein n=1 Tax=Methylobacterium sp. BTF04 TaxID=2708300 RepID=UPI0013D3633E|nr:hypothetical protein [Methylobacterium sp. BTF04]NEU13260.1 hypothetical protein [Methylobacterium sp. BTF04]
MSARFASVTAALVLSAGLLSSPAFAQSYNAPAGIPAAAAPGGFEGQTGRAGAPAGRYDAAPQVHDALTTGSIGARSHRSPRPYTGLRSAPQAY